MSASRKSGVDPSQECLGSVSVDDQTCVTDREARESKGQSKTEKSKGRGRNDSSKGGKEKGQRGYEDEVAMPATNLWEDLDPSDSILESEEEDQWGGKEPAISDYGPAIISNADKGKGPGKREKQSGMRRQFFWFLLLRVVMGPFFRMGL